MKSFLFIGSAKSALKHALAQTGRYLTTATPRQHPDLLLLEPEQSISIAQVRNMIRFLSKKPFQAQTKVVLIHQSQQLTLPAQNALLKTLEEPPDNSYIILTAPNQDQLIPTIQSRCQIINLKPEPDKLPAAQQAELLIFNHQLIQASLGQRLVLIQPYSANRSSAQKFILEQILFWQKALHQPKLAAKLKVQDKQISRILQALLKADNLLKHNINTKLLLDNLIMTW
ncbi:hypothetical protein KKD62_02340 [Patescibacteria group bacterium]|nr:hypothetical protein [Patescibacteria group bacterium]MBU1931707.1 hypothetical protein [Patescibacteria group bacterium]